MFSPISSPYPVLAYPIPTSCDSLQHDVLLFLGRALVGAELPLPALDVLLVLLLRLRQVHLVLGGLPCGDFLLKGPLRRVVRLYLGRGGGRSQAG